MTTRFSIMLTMALAIFTAPSLAFSREAFPQVNTCTDRGCFAYQGAPAPHQVAVRRVVRVTTRAIAFPIDQSWDLAKRAYWFFRGRGYSRQAAAGIVGNLKAESNFNVNVVGDGGLARGLAQWHPDRFAGVRALAAKTGRSVNDFNVQLEYIDHELRTREPLAFGALQNAKTIEQGTAAFIHYERPQYYAPGNPYRAHNYWGRLAYARYAYANFVDIDLTATP